MREFNLSTCKNWKSIYRLLRSVCKKRIENRYRNTILSMFKRQRPDEDFWVRCWDTDYYLIPRHVYSNMCDLIMVRKSDRFHFKVAFAIWLKEYGRTNRAKWTSSHNHAAIKHGLNGFETLGMMTCMKFTPMNEEDNTWEGSPEDFKEFLGDLDVLATRLIFAPGGNNLLQSWNNHFAYKGDDWQ